MSLKVELVESKDAFKLLEGEWNDLYKASSRSTIFNSWDWLYTWWEVFSNQDSRQLYILCIYENCQLLGIAPLQIISTFPLSVITGKKLQFLGSGEHTQDRILSAYGDLLIVKSREIEVCKQIESYLLTNKKDWGFADFNFILKDSLILKCFENEPLINRQLLENGLRYFVPNVDNLTTYLSTLNKRWFKDYHKKNSKLERQGELNITHTKSIDDVSKHLKLLAEMHGSRWIQRTDKNIFDSKYFYQFHSHLLNRLVPQGKAFIKIISLDDTPLASYYAFSDRGQLHYYQSGFYKKHSNKYSPLFLLICKEIGLASEKNQMFDFMYDVEGSYKATQYAAQTETMYRLLFTHQNYRLVFFNQLKLLKTFSEKIKTKLTNIKNKKK